MKISQARQQIRNQSRPIAVDRIDSVPEPSVDRKIAPQIIEIPFSVKLLPGYTALTI
jgi:hypothetical protein